jgi:ComF family protein
MRRLALTSLLAPPLCWACKRAVRAGEPLCTRCRAALRWQRPEPVRLGGLDAYAPLAYEGAARELVRALKYRGAHGLAEPMAAQIAANAPAEILGAGPPLVPDGPALVPAGPALVPVPLHRARRRRRGFNQAGLLAAALAARTGHAVCDCLERLGRSGPQVGSSRAARIAGPGADVRLRPGARAPPRAVIIDDVITTGATLSACARALRAGGCREVVAAAYARTLAR